MIELATEVKMLACTGQALPSGLLVDPCRTCARRSAVVTVLANLLTPAAVFVESARAVGWYCPNQRVPSPPAAPTLM